MNYLLISFLAAYIVWNVTWAVLAVKFMSDDIEGDLPLVFIYDIWKELNINLFGKIFLTILVVVTTPGIFLFAGTYKLFYWLFHIGVKK